MQAQTEPAREAQLSYIRDLRGKKQLTDAQIAWLDGELARGITKFRASEILDRLIPLKDKPRESPAQATADSNGPLPEVEDGRYAVDLQDEDGKLKFFILRTGKNGRWKGFQFIDAQGGPNVYPVKNRDYRCQVLEAIAANPIEAAKRYGQELGHCGRCGLELTDEVSRSIGIGPICRQHWGI